MTQYMLNAVFKFSDHISDAEETLLPQYINLLNFYRQEFCQFNVISVILEQNANLSCLRGKEIKKKIPFIFTKTESGSPGVLQYSRGSPRIPTSPL